MPVRELSSDDAGAPEPGYTFDGFTVDFSEKIMLTQPKAAEKPPAPGTSRA